MDSSVVSRDVAILATDGFGLAATVHVGAGSRRPEGVVLINAATAVPRHYYAKFARHAANQGLLCLTYDYRGVGDSRPRNLRGFDASMSDWGTKDLAGVLAWAKKEHPALPVVAVGHSAGGQIMPLADGAHRIRALLGVASQSGYWGHWPSPSRYRRFVDWHLLVPAVATVAGRLPKWALGQEVPKGVAVEWSRWCRHPEYVVMGDPVRQAAFASWRGRIRALGFSDDSWAPPASIDGLLALYPNAEKEHLQFTPTVAGGPVGHFGFFRETFRDSLWPKASAWLLEQVRAGQ